MKRMLSIFLISATTVSGHAPQEEFASLGQATETSLAPAASLVIKSPSTQFIEASPPHSIEIPEISVEAQTEVYTSEMVEENDGVYPSDPFAVSWWNGGGSPGSEADNTVYLYGHTSSNPAVFNRLKELDLEDEVYVTTEFGRVRYVVDDMFTVAKPDLGADSRVSTVVPGRLVLVGCWRKTGKELTTTRNIVVTAQFAG